jgi:hypothetical protein
MSARTLLNLLAALRCMHKQAARCQVIAWSHGKWDAACLWSDLLDELEDEMNQIQEGGFV